jgi:osmotically-inducible protein OsmY
MSRTQWAVLVAAAGLGLVSMACDDTWRGVKKDTQENTAIAKKEAKDAHLDEKAAQAGETLREAAVTAKEGLEKVGRDIKNKTANAADDAAPAADHARNDVDTAIGKAKARTQEAGAEIAEAAKAAAIHVDVKQALLRDSAIDASHVNVDVDGDKHSLVLRGSVPTLEQKVAAQRVAAERAKGFAVRNELAVMSGN